jgi:hypothetical protein
MTYTTPIFCTDNTEGVDMSTSGYDQPFTLSTSTPEYPAVPVQLGRLVTLSQGGKAVYGIATAAALTLGDVCFLTSTWYAAGLTSTNAATAAGVSQLGVAMTTLATGQYGWFQIEGVCNNINVVSGIAANAKLYTTATAGRLGALATGASYDVNAITITTTSGATSGAYAGYIQPAFRVGSAD